MTQTIDRNSNKNQDIKGKLVAREVYCNVNSLVEYCLKMGYEDRESPVNIDELENYYKYPEYNGNYASFYGGTEEQREEAIQSIKDQVSTAEEELEALDEESKEYTEKQETIDRMNKEIEELEELETEPQEVYEWWAVSNWFYEKLKAQGEVVCDAGSCYVWGRCTTGQAILLDGVISDIAEDMEILEGQANDWSK